MEKILTVMIIIAFAGGLSWLATCGIIKLITLCFGLTFKWSIATGIWLVLCLLSTVIFVGQYLDIQLKT